MIQQDPLDDPFLLRRESQSVSYLPPNGMVERKAFVVRTAWLGISLKHYRTPNENGSFTVDASGPPAKGRRRIRGTVQGTASLIQTWRFPESSV